MKVPRKTVFFVTLCLCSVGNVGILLAGNFMPNANAATVFASPQSGTTFTSRTFSSSNNPAFAQSASIKCDPLSNGIVNINKVVSDPNNIASGSANSLPFTIRLTDNSVENTFTLTGGSPTSQTCITEGHQISIAEVGQPDQFSFTPTFSSDCNSTTIQAGQTLNCTITNTVTGTGNNQAATAQSATIPGTPTIPAAGSSVTAQAATLSPFNPNSNPPFQTCEANARSSDGSIKNSLPDIKTSNLERVPSAQTITLQGNIPLDKVRNAMNSLNTDTVIFSVENDLNPTDGVKTALSNPNIHGVAIIASDDGGREKHIDFDVQNVRTECKFVTIGQAAGPANANVLPIGGLGGTLNNIKIPDAKANKILAGLGPFVTPIAPNSAQPFPPQLNPIFATCQAPSLTFTNGVATVDMTNTANLNKDSLGFYNTKVTFHNLSQVSGHSLELLLTSDIAFADADNAIITQGSNPLVQLSLVANPNHSTSHKIDSTLSDVWTDCKAISANSQTVYQPFNGELALN
jgi:hypothetical protein